jgi:hypothetical protein
VTDTAAHRNIPYDCCTCADKLRQALTYISSMRKVFWSCAAVGALSALVFNLLLLSLWAAAR